MNEFEKFIEFLFRMKAIEQKEREIALQEQRPPYGYTAHDEMMRASLENSKQTLEVIRLTRDLRLLTIILVILGIIQILFMLSKP